MASTDSLRAHLIEELLDLHSAEQQLTDALPAFAKAATSKVLKQAFQKHLKETRGHSSRLKQALRHLGERPTSKTCEAMKGLLEEGNSIMSKAPEGALRDAVMITGAQKVEHYEIASYGTVRTYARVIGEKAVARLLEQTLKEEKTADRTLTQIAEGSVNRDAADEWQAHDEESALSRTAEWVGSAAASASRQLAKSVREAASTVGLAQDRRTRGRGKRSASGATRRGRAGTRKR